MSNKLMELDGIRFVRTAGSCWHFWEATPGLFDFGTRHFRSRTGEGHARAYARKLARKLPFINALRDHLNQISDEALVRQHQYNCAQMRQVGWQQIRTLPSPGNTLLTHEEVFRLVEREYNWRDLRWKDCPIK